MYLITSKNENNLLILKLTNLKKTDKNVLIKIKVFGFSQKAALKDLEGRMWP
jgi:hypothetical protein